MREKKVYENNCSTKTRMRKRKRTAVSVSHSAGRSRTPRTSTGGASPGARRRRVRPPNRRRSSTLAWEIPRAEEPGRLQSTGWTSGAGRDAVKRTTTTPRTGAGSVTRNARTKHSLRSLNKGAQTETTETRFSETLQIPNSTQIKQER